MADVLIALFFVAHGLVHPAIYALPPDPRKPAPFDPSRSRVLAERGVDAAAMQSASIRLAAATAVAYAAAAALLLVGGPWAAVGLLAALIGLTLKSLWSHPWLLVGIAIDLGVLAAVLTGQGR